MNIIEAIKSGKPFRRMNAEFWIKIIINQYQKLAFDTELGWHNALSVDDILADDWEIKE